MSLDRPYVEQNTAERQRMRAMIARLGDDELDRPVNEHWTVAGVLGHIAFWDARILALAGKAERGVPFPQTRRSRRTWTGSTTQPAR
jgi:hypothetical protein